MVKRTRSPSPARIIHYNEYPRESRLGRLRRRLSSLIGYMRQPQQDTINVNIPNAVIKHHSDTFDLIMDTNKQMNILHLHDVSVHSPIETVEIERIIADSRFDVNPLSEGAYGQTQILTIRPNIQLVSKKFSQYNAYILAQREQDVHMHVYQNVTEHERRHFTIPIRVDHASFRQTCYTLQSFAGDGVTMHKYMHNNPRVSEIVKMRLREELLTALIALVKCGVQHNDIKPNNILVTTRNKIILIDFGLGLRIEPFATKEFSVLGENGKSFSYTASNIMYFRKDVLNRALLISGDTHDVLRMLTFLVWDHTYAYNSLLKQMARMYNKRHVHFPWTQ